MAADELIPVDEADLLAVLAMLRDVRAESALKGRDPWAFRQAMITVLTLDTHVALEADITPKSIDTFDARARVKAREFIESIPEEVRARGR